MMADGEPTADVSAKLRSASGLLAADPARAEALAREVLGIVPDSADGLIVLGTALRLQGGLEEARAIFEPLAGAQPRSWIVQFELARVRFGLGESRAAAAPLGAAVALKDDLAAAWRLLGDIALASGDPAAARRAYDRLLAAANREPRLKAAAGALAEGRPLEAERLARSVIAEAPNSAAAKHVLAEAAVRRGRLAEAESLLASCLAAAPDLNLVRHAYAGVLAAAGKIRPALVELDRLLALDPGDHRARMAKLAALTTLGDHEAAALVTAQIVQDFPDQPQAWLMRGAGLRALGRVDEAVQAWRRALAIAPSGGEAWWSLASLETHRFDAAERAAMATALASADANSRDASRLHYAVGRADEEAGRSGDAFDHYVRGGAIERRLSAYDPAGMSEFVRRSQELFTDDFFSRRSGWGEATPGPIFIVGLPRSGSTLVDQILVSHPDVEGLGELSEIQAVADWTAIRNPAARAAGYPDCLESLERGEFARLGREYLGWAAARRRRGTAWFTDKAPGNLLHIGLISLILPNARIIDLRRHPLACCVGAFRQHFAGGWDFSYDLGDLGRYYVDYIDLMAHFDAVLPGRIQRVFYERLIEDTEGEVRRLLDGLGLAFDPACLRFFDNPRAVATPSAEQVRRPIFREGVESWRRFEPWLEPLKAALGPALAAYPDIPDAI
jgi:tetratricopeptide (TPR) repeat protein